jgi:hypothetical protein
MIESSSAVINLQSIELQNCPQHVYGKRIKRCQRAGARFVIFFGEVTERSRQEMIGAAPA